MTDSKESKTLIPPPEEGTLSRNKLEVFFQREVKNGYQYTFQEWYDRVVNKVEEAPPPPIFEENETFIPEDNPVCMSIMADRLIPLVIEEDGELC